MLGPLIHDLLLVAALVALAGAGMRLASTLTPAGLERAISACVIACAAAVIETLALGVVGLGGAPVALALAAALAWLAAIRCTPPPPVRVGRELREWWVSQDGPARIGAGALAGVTVALAATVLHRPEPGYDGLTYHLPEAVWFVQSGHPGAIFDVYYGLPVGSYPLTNEVVLAWLTGISRGFAAAALWSPACALLTVAAGWLGLRRLGVRRAVRALALAALMLGPLLVAALGQPGTDLPALAWLACCCALCTCAVERPALLAPAMVAFALAVGTKTTPAVVGLIALGCGAWACRRWLAAVRWRLASALAVAMVVGGVWYARNLVEHGSPLWPFVAAPWGDPVPPGIAVVSHSMLQRFEATLLDHLAAYAAGISGSLVLLIAGMLVPAMGGGRRALAAAAVVAAGTLAWMDAPVTGAPDVAALGVAAGTAVRYLMPVFASAAVALALSATQGRRFTRAGALAALAAALAWGLRDDWRHAFYVPYRSWVVTGAAAGAAAGALAALRRRRRRPPRSWLPAVPARAAAPAGMLACALFLAAGTDGFLARHALVRSEWDAAPAAFLSSRPGFRTDRASVATAPVALGLLAGDHLTHRLAVVGQSESCARVRARATRGWVVVRPVDPTPVPGHPGMVFPIAGTAQFCLAGLRPLFDDGVYRIYGPEATAAR